MIHVFFVPGMFGSMMEMCFKSFTDVDGKFEPLIAEDGSCHTFAKDFHVTDIDVFRDIVLSSAATITTPIYPWKTTPLDQVLELFADRFESWPTHKKILIHAYDQKWAEINMLFQFYKISLGLDQTLEIFGGNVNQGCIKKWNNNYTHWSDMQTWQYREWLSLFYPTWIQEWITSPKLVSDDFLVISNKDILESMPATLLRVFDHCQVTVVRPFLDFCKTYVDKQQYILQEYRLIETIIQHTIHKQPLSWQPISLIGESILQHHFRQHGYEWRCDGLNDLPTNTSDFHNIIFRASKG